MGKETKVWRGPRLGKTQLRGHLLQGAFQDMGHSIFLVTTFRVCSLRLPWVAGTLKGSQGAGFRLTGFCFLPGLRNSFLCQPFLQKRLEPGCPSLLWSVCLSSLVRCALRLSLGPQKTDPKASKHVCACQGKGHLSQRGSSMGVAGSSGSPLLLALSRNLGCL